MNRVEENSRALRYPPAWLWVGLILAATLPFLPAIQNEFVNWDDPGLIINNVRIRSLSFENLSWMFRTVHEGPYQPIAWLSYSLDYYLWNNNPAGFHATNILLHCLNSILLMLTLWSATRISGGPKTRDALLILLATMLFAIHPLRVETVAWASERRGILAGTFAIATVWSYLEALQARSRIRSAEYYLISLLCFGLGLCSKATLVTLPLALLLLDWYLSARGAITTTPRRALLTKTPYLVLGSLAAWVAVYGQTVTGALRSVTDLGWVDRLIFASFSMGQLVLKTLFPLNLSPHYQRPISGVVNQWSILAIAALWLILSIQIWRKRKRYRAVTLLWFSAAVLLLPVSGLAPIGEHITADRYSYIPAIFISLAVLLHGQARTSRWVTRSSSWLISGVVFLALGALSFAQGQIWRNSETLWSHALRVNPDSCTARIGLARAWIGSDKHQQSIPMLQQGLEICPSDIDLHFQLVRALQLSHRTEEAIKHLEQAVESQPESYELVHGLGSLYRHCGDAKLAPDTLQRAHELDSGALKTRVMLAELAFENRELSRARQLLLNHHDPHAPTNIIVRQADMLFQCGNAREAADLLSQVAKDDPAYLKTYELLGSIYESQQLWREAELWYLRGMRILPETASLPFRLGGIAKKRGLTQTAIKHYRAALDRQPAYFPAHYELGSLLQRTGSAEEAIPHYQKVIVAYPGHVGAANNLALALSSTKKYRQSVSVLNGALKLHPDNLALKSQLAWTLAACPENDVRKPSTALDLAKELTEQTPRDPRCWDILAIAQAALGDFSDAIDSATKAEQMASKSHSTLAKAIARRIELYRESTPFVLED